jgi:hypothetical protein
VDHEACIKENATLKFKTKQQHENISTIQQNLADKGYVTADQFLIVLIVDSSAPVLYTDFDSYCRPLLQTNF